MTVSGEEEREPKKGNNRLGGGGGGDSLGLGKEKDSTEWWDRKGRRLKNRLWPLRRGGLTQGGSKGKRGRGEYPRFGPKEKINGNEVWGNCADSQKEVLAPGTGGGVKRFLRRGGRAAFWGISSTSRMGGSLPRVYRNKEFHDLALRGAVLRKEKKGK